MARSARAAFGWIGQVVAWLVIIGGVLAVATAVLVPRIAGGTPYTVLTGSMQPKYPPGTLVVVKPVDFADIGVGDVVTFQLESGKAAVATHRVVGTADRFDGTRVLMTQGDANQEPDRDPVLAEQVRGEVWYSVPYLGYVNTVLTGDQRQWAVYGASALLIGYAAFMLVGALRDRRSAVPEAPRPEPEVPTDQPPEPRRVVPAARPPRRLVPATAGAVLLVAPALVLVMTHRSRQSHKQSSRQSRRATS